MVEKLVCGVVRALKRNGLLLFCVCYASGASAASLAFQCDMDVKPGKFISQTYFAGVDDARKKGVVSDEVLLRYNKGPIGAKILRNNAQTLRLAWSVEEPRNRRKQYTPRLDFELKIRRQTKRATVIVRAAGFTNVLSAKGICKDISDKKLPKF